MSIKITGLDDLMKKLNNPEQIAKEVIQKNGGLEIECPNCQKIIKVPTTGMTCSCGKEIIFK